MIIRRQWAGNARVLQVLNLIGPEGPIAPRRNPREEPQGGTSGRKPGEEPQGGTLGRAGSIRPTGPTAPQPHRPHSTTGPTAPQAPYPQYTVCSQHHYFHITHHIAHHPSIFILSTVSTNKKQREISIARWRK